MGRVVGRGEGGMTVFKKFTINALSEARVPIN